jgi:hypothetical protein
LGNFVPVRTPRPVTSERRASDNADFVRIKTYLSTSTAFRRIHDDRTPHVDAATGAGRADWMTSFPIR